MEFDGFALWLTTEDGIREINRICLEPAVYLALLEYVARLPKRTGLTAALRERPIPEAES